MVKLVGAVVAGVLLAALSVMVCTTPTRPEKKLDVDSSVELHKSHIENNKKLFDIVTTQGSRIWELEEKVRERDKVIQDLTKTNTRIVGILEAHDARLGKLEKP